MMPWSQEQYEEAKGLLAGGELDKALVPKLQAKVAQYEDDRARGQLPAPAVRNPTAMEPSPSLQQTPDKPLAPGEKGTWIPQRPLGVSDYIPADAGGKLVNWHDMPIETYRRTVAGPAREQLIRDGIGAQALLAKFGTVSTISPDIMSNIMTTIAKGKAAEAQTPDKVTEEDPGYKAYNEQQWQEALQKHMVDPEAGPMQRLSQLPGTAGTLARASAEILPKSIAFARGGLDSMTLGLGAGPTDALLNAVEPGAGDQERSIQESRPWSSAAGNVAGMLNPYGAGGALFRGVYGGARGLLGAGRLARLGAGAAAGALSNAAEGAGQDISRGETDDLAAKTGERLFLGGLTGAAGEGLSQAGGALANKISTDTLKRIGRPFFQIAERAGYKFRPIRGVKESPEAEALWSESVNDPEGMSPAEAVARRARGPINDAIQAEDEALQAQVADETEGYLRTTRKAVPIQNTWKALVGELRKLQSSPVGEAAPLGKKLASFSDVDIVPQPPRKWLNAKTPSSGETYIQARQAREYGITAKDLSPDSQVVLDQNGVTDMADLPGSTWLRLRPRAMNARDFHTLTQDLGTIAEDAAKSNGRLATAWQQIERGALQDRARFPETKPVRGLTAEVPGEPGETETVTGWPALSAQQSQRIGALQSERELIGATSGKRSAQAGENDLRPLTNNLMAFGKPGHSVAAESAARRYAPPDIRKELDTIATMAMSHEVAGTHSPQNLTSRRGIVGEIGSIMRPRLYALGREADRELGANFPISDKLFAWLNARAPRATQWLPGMGQAQIAAIIAKQDEMNRRPKTADDLTPEQRAVLFQAMSQGAPQ